MKIYLAGSISGGRKFADNLKFIAKALEELGHEIISPFVVDIEINKQRYPGLKGEQLARAHFEEDLDLVLNKADAIAAEVSQPSHGVGIEIGAITTKKMLQNIDTPILLLRDESLKDKKTSKLLSGNPHAVFSHYSKENVKEILAEYL